jgi:WD40 repeat protein
MGPGIRLTGVRSGEGSHSIGLRFFFILLICCISLVSPVPALEPRWEYQPAGDHISSIALSANGSAVAAGTKEGHLVLLNETTGNPLWTRDIPGEVIVALSPDGNLVVSGAKEDRANNKGAVRLYYRDGSTGWKIITGSVNDLAISADSKRVAAGIVNGQVYITDLTGSNVTIAPGPPDAIMAREFAMATDGSTGAYIPCNDFKPTVVLVNLKTQRKTTVELPAGVLAISGNGSRIAVGFGEGTAGSLTLLDKNGKKLWTNRTDPIAGLAISSDGALIAAASGVGLYLVNQTPDQTLIVPSGSPLTSVAMSKNGSYFATGADDGSVSFRYRNGSELWNYQVTGFVTEKIASLKISSDGTHLLAATDHSLYYFSTGVREEAISPGNPGSTNTTKTNSTGTNVTRPDTTAASVNPGGTGTNATKPNITGTNATIPNTTASIVTPAGKETANSTVNGVPTPAPDTGTSRSWFEELISGILGSFFHLFPGNGSSE